MDFKIGSVRFRAFSCYFPTTWDTDEAVSDMYTMLNLLLAEGDHNHVVPILGGDFNASLGKFCDYYLSNVWSNIEEETKERSKINKRSTPHWS